MRILPLVLVIPLGGAVSSALAAQKPAGDSARIGFTPPQSVAEFRLNARQVLGPGQGAQLRYQRAGERDWIDVYVYPTPQDSSCARACDTVAVEHEASDFGSLIPELVRRHYYDKLRVAADEHVGFASPEGHRGRHLRLEGIREGIAVTSQFYLYPAGRLLVKVRATYPPNPQRDSVVAAFATRFADQQVGYDWPCAVGEPRTPGIAMSVDVAGEAGRVHAQVDSVLRALGYDWDDPPAGEHAWQTRPQHTWPARETWGTMRSQPSPGWVIRVGLAPRGAQQTLSVEASLMCGMQNRQSESAVALIAAMEVVSAFPETRRH
jgi:hypothetical protein